MKGIWITWEIQRRNRSISEALGWPLFEIWVDQSPLVRYFKSIIKTVFVIKKEKPDILIVQNPSIILAVWAVLLRIIFKYVLVIDAHNAGIFPSEGKSYFLQLVSRWLQKKADLTIVTTEEFKRVVEQNGGKGFVLPDALPQVPTFSQIGPHAEFNIVNICTFSEDEPYQAIIDAARGLPANIKIFFTGRFAGKVDPKSLPANVELLGFIDDAKFWSILGASDVIMDLTLRESCLVCGAYEGVALSKPLILSNTRTLRQYFNEGCIYVDPTAESIRSGIFAAVKQKKRLEKEINHLKQSLNRDWQLRKEQILATFHDLVFSAQSDNHNKQLRLANSSQN